MLLCSQTTSYGTARYQVHDDVAVLENTADQHCSSMATQNSLLVYVPGAGGDTTNRSTKAGYIKYPECRMEWGSAFRYSQ